MGKCNERQMTRTDQEFGLHVRRASLYNERGDSMAEHVTSWMDYESKVEIDDFELWITHRCVTSYNNVSGKFMVTISAQLENQVFVVRERMSYLAISTMPGPRSRLARLLNAQVASYIHNHPEEFKDIMMEADACPMCSDPDYDDDDLEWDEIPYNDADWDSDGDEIPYNDADWDSDDIPGGPDSEDQGYSEENPFDKAERDEEEYWNSDDD